MSKAKTKNKNIEDAYPLSPLQEGLLFHSLYAPESGVYVTQVTCTLGNLDVQALEQAWRQVVARHPILRTAFVWKNIERPLQVVGRQARVPLERQDWRGLSAREQEERFAAYLQADRRRGFQLSTAPLMRLALFQIGEETHRLVWSHHHILLDGWSVHLLIKEVFLFYEGVRKGQNIDLPPARPYRDYIAWLRQQDMAAAEAFWRPELAGFTTPNSLGVDRVIGDPSEEGKGPGEHRIRLSAATTAALQSLARTSQLTLNTLVQGALALLLSRYSGEDGVVFGTVVSGRPPDLPGVDATAGLFINTLPVRAQISSDAHLLPWLRRLQERQVEMRRYEYSPLVNVQGWSDAPRDTPLFKCLYAFENYPVGAPVAEHELSIEVRDYHVVEKATYPLTIISGPSQELTLKALYDRHSFDLSTVDRLLGHLQTLLESIVADPGRRISSLPLITEPERRRLLVEWNGAVSDYPRERCVHELFEAQVEQRPDAIALVFAEEPSCGVATPRNNENRPWVRIASSVLSARGLLKGNKLLAESTLEAMRTQGFSEEQLTYRELNRRANQLAAYLRKLGVGPETPVGFCLERSPEMVIGILGILKAGGTYVPLDPTYPRERLAFMLEDTRTPVLLTDRGTEGQRDRGTEGIRQSLRLSVSPSLRPSVPPSPIVVCLDTDWELIAQESEVNLEPGATAEHLAYVMYTSGSTGAPKGIGIPHRAINRLVFNTNYIEITPDDRMALASNSAFDAATFELWGALLRGARLMGIGRDVALAPRDLASEIQTQGISVMFLTTALFNQMAREVPAAFGSLRSLLFGGEAVDLHSVKAVLKHNPPARLLNVYGPTESTTFTTWYPAQAAPEDATSIPIGRPISNTQTYILDRNQQPMPVGVPGELHIGGDGLAREYVNRPDLTAEKFISNPFSDEPGSRLYKTGDLARYLPDGDIEFLGRIDHQVKIRGFRIELAEIESALSQHPSVREAVALVREDAPGEKRLVAYLVFDPGSASTISELRSFLQQKLPDYMTPSAFVSLEALPLNPNGKVDRGALPAPEQTRSELAGAYVAPRTPVEEVLAGIWAEALKVEQVSVYDNFFELGGHSLLATQVISRSRETFQVELPLRHVFEAPTLASLAEKIETAMRAGQGLQIPPLAPISRDGQAPLSFAQRRLWFLDQLTPGDYSYHIPAGVRLSGELNLAALQESLNEIVRRHEILRATFADIDGHPVQVISPTTFVPLPIVDLTDLCQTDREAELLRLATKDSQRPFDLAAGPLFRTTLVRLRAEEHAALFTKHHIISDGWSMGVLIKEFASLYEAFSQGRPSPLPALPIQYADFAHWQRQWVQGAVLEKQLSYWKAQLSGSPPVLELPMDRPRPAVQTFRGGAQPISLPGELSEALKELSRRERATLFMTLLAAFQTLLHRYTGQDDILVGSPIAGRTHAATESLIGFFVNTLVLRTDFSGAPTFREILRQARKVALDAYAHQDAPFEQLVDALQPDRDMSHAPLFQVMFALQNAPRQDLKLPGLALSRLKVENATAKFDLSLYLTEIEQGLIGSLEYNTDLFDAATINRMAGHFQTLLTRLVEDPQRRISDLPLFGEAERRRLIVEWNETKSDYPQDQRIHQLFEAQVERTPDIIAAVFEDERLTYRELNHRANQLAHHLRGLGVRPGALVGICVERGLEMLIGLLGILKAGGAYVPLDPAYPKERLAFMLQDAQAPVLIADCGLRIADSPTEDRESRIEDNNPQSAIRNPQSKDPQSAIRNPQSNDPQSPIRNPQSAIRNRVVCLDSDWRTISQNSRRNLVCEVRADNLAYVIYTSGSTGKPKGVQISHRAVVNFLESMRQQPGLTAEDILLSVTTLSFDIAALELFLPLTVGARVVVVSREVAADGDRLLERLIASGATVMQATPATWRLLLEAEWQGGEQLKILCGGEALSRELANQLLKKGVSLWNLYGPTETTIWSAAHEVGPGQGAVSIGRPIANTQIYLLDRHLQPLPIGVPGELHIGGDGLSEGYLKRPELTAEKFVPNPFSSEPGARLYGTGDLARYFPDGAIEALGRIDHQVKVRGFRIELGEIEAILSQHPAVQEVVALVREDVAGDKRLVAYLVSNQEPAPTVSELRGFLKEKLPEYMAPSAFLILEKLPLTPNGKVDRRALPKLDGVEPEREGIFVAPRSPVEEMLAEIWVQVLGLEQVSVHDNFFELGGHSLLATQVVSRARGAFQVELPLRAVFEAPTVVGLAERIEAAQRAGGWIQSPPIRPVSRDQELPLSFAQQRLWFLDQFSPGAGFYNIPAAIRLRGRLNVAALEESLSEIARRHEILRTTFANVGGRPIQVISPAFSVTLPRIDLSGLSESEREAELQRLANEEAQRPFDLARGPLFRATLAQLAAEEQALLFTTHHIISDGWSIGALIKEVAALYEAFSQGRPSPLTDLPVQYADYAYWQRQWMEGEKLERELSYWKRQLSGSPPVLELPTDRPRPAAQTFRGAAQPIRLPKELSESLKDLSRREGVTLFMTLLAAFQTLLHRYSGQDDILVGAPIAGRTRAEIEDLIGLFINMLVLRAGFAGDPTVRELLRQTRQVTLDAYAHQDLPFERLVEALQPNRALSHSPLFQVMFVLQNMPRQVLRAPGLSLSAMPVDAGTAKFDLTLALTDTGQGLSGRLEYNTDLFDAATISRIADHFQALLESIVTDPKERVSALPLMTGAETERLLVEWNQTEVKYPAPHSLPALFEAQVERTPDAVAVVFEGEHLTYRELNRQANRLAHHLRRSGVGPESLVGVCMERSPEMMVGILGVLKAGGAYAPLDPAYPLERLAFMLEDSQASVLLTQQSRIEDRGSRIEDRTDDAIFDLRSSILDPRCKVVCLDAIREALEQESEENPASGVTVETAAYVLYTSGSTGRPKGVIISHGAICNHMLWLQDHFSLTAADRTLQKTPISFDASGLEFYAPLLSGGLLILARPGGHQDSAYLVRMIDEHRVTILQSVPSLLRALVEEPGFGQCESLRRVICAGEALPAELQERFNTCLAAELHNFYGPTEAAIDVSYWPYEHANGCQIVPIGRPIANTQIYPLDAHLQPVAVGIPGELHIGGANLARGYLNQPELTAEKFIPNPFSGKSGARLYRTGDLTRYSPDGAIEYLGRIDHQVKIRGFRIELGEIEAALNQHPALRETAVLAREDVTGAKRLVAYVVAGQESAPSIGELRAFLRETLPEYMTPAAFVFLEAMPLAPNGKVNRRALPEPDRSRPELEAAFVAPRTLTEEKMAELWSQLLGVERVGVYDNFFELGGHSLLATQLVSRARETFGVELSLISLFDTPVIADLAERISQSQAQGPEMHGSKIERIQRGEKSIDELVAELTQLTDEEAQALLSSP